MIARALLLLVPLAVGYSLLAPHLLPQAALTDPAESQIMRNLVRAEQVLRADPPAKAVLLGTSMSERLEDPPGIANLSMSGCSPATGLAVLHRAGIAPRILLVETNYFPGSVSPDVYGNLFGSLPWGLRKAVPLFGYSYRPATVLVNGIRWRIRQHRAGAGRQAEGGVSPELFARLLAEELEKFQEPVERARELPHLEEVRGMIEELTVRGGTQVVFFEMPVHPAVAASPRYVTHRAILRAEFPPERYTWLSLPEADYRTTDGVHLLSSSALIVRDFLVETVARLSRGQAALDGPRPSL